MSDLVKRLRKQADEILDPGYPYYGTPELVREAADEIERLQAVVDAARELVDGPNVYRDLVQLEVALRALDGEP